MIQANSLIFPKPSFSVIPSHIDKYLTYIPKYQSHKKLRLSQLPTSRQLNNSSKEIKAQQSIPCLYLQGGYESSKLIIYFHGNAEDIFRSYELVKNISFTTGRSILAVEYPGYSLYKTNKGCDAQKIEEDAEIVLQHMKNKGFQFKNITIMGRSIGSGVAVYLASKYDVGHLILLSPFLSICEVVKDIFCEFVSKLLKNRFPNEKRIKEIRCPCLIVHGLADQIIRFEHSVRLSSMTNGMCMLKLVKEMTHSCFHYHKDFLCYVLEFYANFDKHNHIY